MPPSGPFANHRARWSEAVKNLPSAHDVAKNEAVGHIRDHVVSAAEGAGMDPNHVGVFWYQGRPHLSVERGTETEALEYGDLDRAPQATLRNAARNADKTAARVYHNTFVRELGL